MQDTFLAAAQKLTQLREPSKLRAWLFAIARHESLRRAKSRSRAVPTDDFPDLAATDVSPEDEVSRSDLTEIVWAAAAGLSERDRVLLDLHLRQGLDGQELADSIGVTAGHAYVLMNRLRAQVERALGSLLVARLGRDDCETLDGILSGWDGTFSVLIRKRVARHVDGCDLCSERRGRVASPLSLLAAAPLIPASPEMRDRLLSRIELTSARSGRGGWRSDGFPPAMIASRAARRLAAAAAALAVAGALGGGAFLALRDTSNDSLQVAAAPPVTTAVGDPTPTTSTASSVPSVSSASSASSASTTSRPAATTTALAPSATTSPTATVPVVIPTAAPPATTSPIVSPTTSPATTSPTTTATSPTTTAQATTTTTTTAQVDQPPVVKIVRVTNTTIYQTTGGCTPVESYFEAVATDDETIGRVRISWHSASGSGSADMIRDNRTWFGKVGRFPDVYGANTDTIDVTVTAWDSASQTGTDSRAITLVYAIAPYC